MAIYFSVPLCVFSVYLRVTNYTENHGEDTESHRGNFIHTGDYPVILT